MKNYIMKDLGYGRMPTNAILEISFEDLNEQYNIPLQIVIDSRDEHYKKDQEDTVESIKNGSLDFDNIYDWVNNNMNWSDLSEHATKLEMFKKVPDHQGYWNSAYKEIIGDI